MLLASAALIMVTGQSASASIVPTIGLATAANYSVLGGQTVTNTGPSILDKSVGLAPGSAVVGFPPGTVLAPGTIQAANAVALQAESDLTTAYIDAAGRSTEFTTVSDLTSGTPLLPGVYANASRGPLLLTGAMTLDGQNDPNAVFIFQTDSSLITGSGSVVNLINGASECNIFWQVGSSATIGTGSAFVGNVLALTSIAVQTGATVRGRALARNGEVTLDNNVFTSTNCALSPEGAPAATTTVAAAPIDTAPAAPAPTVATVPGFNVTDITLPRTGSKNVAPTSSIAALALILGAGAILLARRRRPTA
ncbi:MAG TPA: ice-binding family protein [Ilumatobacteraceae bacterium]|nr:ice-binding family protein [Ilumatobacteraceae bacterium]